jgi:hypothetical protein
VYPQAAHHALYGRIRFCECLVAGQACVFLFVLSHIDHCSLLSTVAQLLLFCYSRSCSLFCCSHSCSLSQLSAALFLIQLLAALLLTQLLARAAFAALFLVQLLAALLLAQLLTALLLVQLLAALLLAWLLAALYSHFSLLILCITVDAYLKDRCSIHFTTGGVTVAYVLCLL